MLFADAAAAEQPELFDHRPRQFANRQASNPRERSSNGMKVRLADGCVDTGFDSGHRRLRDGFTRSTSDCLGAAGCAYGSSFRFGSAAL